MNNYQKKTPIMAMPVRPDEILYIVAGGFVVALSKAIGRELWRSEVTYGTAMITITYDTVTNMLYVSSNGKVYGVNSIDGKIIWKNGLPGHNYFTANVVIPDHATNEFKSAPASTAPPPYQAVSNFGGPPYQPTPNYGPSQPLYPAMSEQVPGTYMPSIASSPIGVIYCSSNSNVCCIRKMDGTDVWRTTVTTDASALLVEDNFVFTAGRGKVNALDAGTGKILWMNDLPGLGYGLVQMATIKHSTVAQGVAWEYAQPKD